MSVSPSETKVFVQGRAQFT